MREIDMCSRKKIILVVCCLLLAVMSTVGCGKSAETEEPELWTITGRYCETIDGKSLLLSDTEGAISISPASDDDMFADLENGDEIEISVESVAETYPEQATVYNYTLLQKGTVEDLDEKELLSLINLGGWEFPFLDVDDAVETVHEEDTEGTTQDGVDMDHPPVNWGTPDGPEAAAENYYKNTVFELVSLDVVKSSSEYVKFSVVSKKDGEIVEPNRTIELCYDDGAWTVISEGY
jgi:hypothetical protein